MPYITQNARTFIDKGCRVKTSGELNYKITKMIKDYMEDHCPKAAGMSPNYAMFNDMIGVLECCKLELYRRMVAPYEDTKKEVNGDVYHGTDNT
jgi:hypothetical protein